MRAKEFIEVLEAQIRAELRDELEKELANELRQDRHIHAHREAFNAQGEITDTWLAVNTQKTIFIRKNAARQAYYHEPKSQRPQRRAAPESQNMNTSQKTNPKTNDEWVKVTTTEGLMALELLIRHGSGVGMETNRVRLSDLKAMWRRAALKVHPDRHAHADSEHQAQMSALFRQLTDAYATVLTFCPSVAAR